MGAHTSALDDRLRNPLGIRPGRRSVLSLSLPSSGRVARSLSHRPPTEVVEVARRPTQVRVATAEFQANLRPTPALCSKQQQAHSSWATVLRRGSQRRDALSTTFSSDGIHRKANTADVATVRAPEPVGVSHQQREKELARPLQRPGTSPRLSLRCGQRAPKL